MSWRSGIEVGFDILREFELAQALATDDGDPHARLALTARIDGVAWHIELPPHPAKQLGTPDSRWWNSPPPEKQKRITARRARMPRKRG